ncbi:hypothetical protein GGI07_005398 [Coemansia sp. Benny D115]|nr:hypothetical protein GGI07_005398 [Coemansia sp. Benny D115]
MECAASQPTLALRVRQSSGNVVELEVSSSAVTVAELKRLLSERTEIPIERMRLILGSEILADARTLESYGIADGSADLRLVRLAGADRARLHNVNGITSSNNTPTSPLGSMMANQTRQMFLTNPQLAQTLMMANPQMRQAFENNPELRQLMRDPQIIQQSLDTAQNPRLMREVQRNNDRMLSNLESAPGGYAHIRRMYHNVQEPLARAVDMGSNAPLDELNRRRARILGVTKPDASKVNTTPLPNPWVRNRPRANTRPSAEPRNPFAVADQVSRNADRLARLDISAGQLSARQAAQQRLRDPFSMAQLQAQFGSLLPPFFSPSGRQQPGSARGGNGDGIHDTTHPLPPSASASESASVSAPAPAPALASELAHGSAASLPTQMSAMSIVNPAYDRSRAEGGGSQPSLDRRLAEASRRRFREELEQLEEMGFSDKEKNLRALIETDGDMASALSIIADEDDL